MKGLPDKAYELAIVDPPYGIGKFWEGGDGKGFNYRKGMQQDSNWNENTPDKKYFDELERCCVNKIVWGWNYYTEFLGSSDSLIFWDKRMGAPNYSAGEFAITTFGHKIRIYTESRNSSRNGLAIHPCQKSVRLYKWLLRNYAKPGDKIFDSHGGSFSSAIACYDLGFDLDICELDADYFKASSERFERHVAKYAPASDIPITKEGQVKLF